MDEPDNKNDDQLIQSLREFGENVDKITDKNRKILQKKLNHFLARRRMSEKLSQSVLMAKSPKGRGKRNSKQSKNVTLSEAPNVVMSSQTGYHVPQNEPASSVSVLEAKLNESKASVMKRGRKSVVLNTARDVNTKKTVDLSPRENSKMEISSSEGESHKNDSYEPPQKKQANSANLTGMKLDASNTIVVKRGRRNLVVGSAKDVTDITETIDSMQERGFNLVESQNDKNAVTKRRTYSCDKSDFNSASKEQSVAASRIPKLALSSKSAIQKEIVLSPSAVKEPTVVKKSYSKSNQLSPVPIIAKSTAGVSKKVPSICVNVHVIDSTIGKAAANVNVEFQSKNSAGMWTSISSGSTDVEGHSTSNLSSGLCRFLIDSEHYFKQNNQHCFYPFIEFGFNVAEVSSSVDIQVVLNPFGFSAQRIG